MPLSVGSGEEAAVTNHDRPFYRLIHYAPDGGQRPGQYYRKRKAAEKVAHRLNVYGRQKVVVKYIGPRRGVA